MFEKRSPEERAEFERELADRLREWLDEEGLSSKKEQDDNATFHYVAEYPKRGGVTMHVIRPKDRQGLVLLLGIHLSQGHAQAFKKLGPEDQRQLTHRLRKTAFEGGEVGFSMQVDEGIPARWQFDRLIYDDAISRHTVLTGMRKVFSKHLEIVEVLNMELGGAAAGGGGGGSTASTAGEDVKGYL